jgi:hypothetical protein
MENTVVNNAGIASAYLFAGGAYNFTNCTFANYNAPGRNTPLFILQNYFQSGNTIFVRPITEAYFSNCVMYGGMTDEIALNIEDHPQSDFLFDHCLIKNSETYTTSSFQNCLWNQDPNFVSTEENDFKFNLPSPLNNSGNAGTATMSDIEGNPRTGPDIGAYEVE